MKNRDVLREKLRNTRDAKEDFYLQGSRLHYSVKERIVPLDPNLHLKLSSMRNQNDYTPLEYIAAIFGAFDVTVLTSEDMNFKITDEIKVLIDRIHSGNGSRINLEDLTFSRKKAIKQPFELKISQGSDHLLHEMFVSFFVTNRLRKIIPNYQLCFAGLKAQTPNDIHVPLEQHTCPFDTTNKVDYLLLENLDGISLTQALKTATLNEYLSWFVQIILSLEMGVVHCGFTHNNLNPDNIQIVPVEQSTSSLFKTNDGGEKDRETIKIRYFHNNEQWLLDASSIAVIKNLETAHVKHKYDVAIQKTEESDEAAVQEMMIVNRSEHFGPVGFEGFGIFYNETRPFMDIYKFLMWSLRITQKFNRALYQEIKILGGFFGHTTLPSLESALDAEEHLGYIYNTEISTLEKSRSLRELLAFAISSFPKELSGMLAKESSYASATILSCPNYCLLDGYESINMTSNFDEKMVLENWTLREVMERLEGLKKRSQEMKRISALVCRSNFEGPDGNVCQPASEEAIESRTQYVEYFALVRKWAKQLKDRQIKEITEMKVVLDEKIRVANIDVDSYKLFRKSSSKASTGIGNLDTMHRIICRERESIKGKIVTLVGLVSYLNIFVDKFPDAGEIPQFSLSGMNDFS